MFTYCNNNPVNDTDYDGHFGTPIQWACAAIGGVAGWFFGDYIAKMENLEALMFLWDGHQES
jgi:hypothetical protein